MKSYLVLAITAMACSIIGDARSITIDHAFGLEAEFSHRGYADLIVDPSGELAPTASVSPMKLNADASQLEGLIADGGLYLIRVAIDDSSTSHIVAAVPACHLRLASFREEITLHIDWDGLIVGLDYKAPVGPLASTKDCTKMPVQAMSEVATTVRVVRAASAQSVPLQVIANSPPPGLTKLKDSTGKQDTKAAGNQSMLVKYWYIFLPLVISWVFSSASSDQGGSASGPGVGSQVAGTGGQSGGR